MRMQVERFLAITAVLATGSVMSVGCVSESDTDTKTDANVNTGGTSSGGQGGSSGSSTGGTAGTATGGSAGTATGGTAGTGTGGTAGAGGACFGDTTVSDAGAEGGVIDCSTLPYIAEDCGTDAGVEGSPTGVAMCYYIATNGRPGVQEAMYSCLAAISGDACATTHDDAVSNCVQSVYGNTCPPADPSTAPSANCAGLQAECPAITEADCKINIDPLTQAAGDAVFDCYQAGSGACDDDFLTCLGLP